MSNPRCRVCGKQRGLDVETYLCASCGTGIVEGLDAALVLIREARGASTKRNRGKREPLVRVAHRVN